MRTSCDRPQACATEAILSTTTLLMPLTMSRVLGALAGTPVKYTRRATILENPSASAGVHSPAASPYTPLEAAISE